MARRNRSFGVLAVAFGVSAGAFMGSHENLHLTEKFTRVSRDILNYEFTVDDPTTWTNRGRR